LEFKPAERKLSLVSASKTHRQRNHPQN
jgi:hypothetical protein